MEPVRWHSWQERCRIGATSFVNVTSWASCAAATAGAAKAPSATVRENGEIRIGNRL